MNLIEPAHRLTYTKSIKKIDPLPHQFITPTASQEATRCHTLLAQQLSERS